MNRKSLTIIIIIIFVTLEIGIIFRCGRTSKVIESEKISLLIRCDDIGMSHATNIAFNKLLEKKMPISVSVMFVCPWYQETVDILQKHSEVSIGVHLTLNAEWKNYRWGPIIGKEAVPSLVDSCGYFFPSRTSLIANNPKSEEVEKELRAQINRAIQTDLQIDYVDYHMSTIESTPEFRAIAERLAKEYGLGISCCFGETNIERIYNVSIENKTDSLAAIIKRLKPGSPKLIVFHIGMETPEMNVLLDLNQFGLPEMSRHRYAELKALCSKQFSHTLKSKKIRLLTYRELISERGLENMNCPVSASQY